MAGPDPSFKLRKNVLRLFAFFIPAALLLTAIAHLGVYPFGEKSLLVVDMDSEYIDYYMHLHQAVRDGSGILRSWNMGMGLNMLGLIAFYTASPLNLLLLLAPAGSITETVLVITLIKFGLCGLFFSIYTSYTFGRDDFINLGCSVAYAMMGYNIAYSSNLMWLDGVALLPLVLMGVEKILREDKYLQFVLSLIFVFFSGYYIGYMLGVFTFLYFTARFFTEHSGFKAYPRKFVRFLLCAALAAGCCAILLIPAFLNLYSGQNGMFQIPAAAAALRYPFVQIAAKLLPGVYDSLTDSGLPNIFVTTPVLLLCLLFFLNKLIPLREKLIFGGLIGFMLISFSWGILDLAWHAFETPTWFPARYSFVFSFLLIHVALRGLRAPSGLSYPRVLAGAGLLVLLFTEVALGRYRYVDGRNVMLGFFLALAYSGIYLAMAYGVRGRRVLPLMALTLVCMESWYAAAAGLDGIDGQFGYRTRDSYYNYRDAYLPAVDFVEREYPGEYRVETPEQRSANGGMALGYKGISHYSTTTDQSLNTLLSKLGYNTGTINELRFTQSTPLTNGLLGVRYLLAREDMGAGYELVGQAGRVGIYENTAAFPLAFFAEKDALSIDTGHPDPFLLQNSWVDAMLPDNSRPDVFRPLDTTDENLSNLVPDRLESGALRYSRLIRDTPGELEMLVHNPERLEAYAFFPLYRRQFAKAAAFVDSQPVGNVLEYRSNTVLHLGSDEWATLALYIGSDNAYMGNRLIYGLDLGAAQKAAMLAKSQAMDISRFDALAVDGKITAPRSGILATSIPYDNGWTVRVDGKKSDPSRLMGVFLAVELPEGEHSITMRYLPPGFVPGAILSALCVAGLVFWRLWRIMLSRHYSGSIK